MRDAESVEQDFEAHLYIITHDLKTFSRAMGAIPEWIREDLDAEGIQLPSEVNDHLTMLAKYAAGMDRMLNGLTELSRVGRLADSPSTVDIKDALSRVWDTIEGRDQFKLDLSSAQGTVLAPANDLDRLLFALLSNAVWHHDKPIGRVFARTVDYGDRLVLLISDDGPGIEQGFREKVFAPLYTLQPKDQCETAGMGLAVAKKILQTFGGKIEILSPPGGLGCLIECDLPRDPGLSVVR